MIITPSSNTEKAPKEKSPDCDMLLVPLNKAVYKSDSPVRTMM